MFFLALYLAQRSKNILGKELQSYFKNKRWLSKTVINAWVIK